MKFYTSQFYLSMNELKSCPQCNIENPVAANFCRHCRYDFPEETKNGESLKPQIVFFKVCESNYVNGSHIHIEWSVNKYSKILLNDKDVTFCEGIDFYVEKETQLKLVALNDYDQDSQTLCILPAPLPRISLFQSNVEQVIMGENIKLSWNVKNAKRIILRDYETLQDVSAFTSIQLTPMRSGIYTLQCESIDENVKIERNVHITVIPNVKIKLFISDQVTIIESEMIKLSWEVENDDHLFLFPGNIDVSGRTFVHLYPFKTTTYRLIASNGLTSDEEILTIYVRQLPKLELSFVESISRLQIPDIKINFSEMLGIISKEKANRLMVTTEKVFIYKTICDNLIVKQLKSLLGFKLKPNE